MTAACLMSTYQPLALSFSKGLGTRLWDQAGREYLDAVAGVAVTNVGHSHPKIVCGHQRAGRACCCTPPTSTASTGSSGWRRN